jgi:2-polyprenyl-3-methyl-5-hydroxy-6-metoxy-1,4-benzoquinol methylase
MPDGSRFGGELPCLLCRHARRRKSREEWTVICGRCRDLSEDEVDILYWNQEFDPDRVGVPPNLLRLSRLNSDARYADALGVIRRWPVKPGALLLDVGCGISAQAGSFREFRYVGADINAARIGYAARAHPWARYTVQSVLQLAFPTGTFDAILCLEVIEHLEPYRRLELVRELLRILQPGGLLVLSTPDGRITPWKWVFGAKCERSHFRELREQEVRDLMNDAGGRVAVCHPVDNFVQPAGKLAGLIAHLVADRSRWRMRIGAWWERAGYRTLLYGVTPRDGHSK